MAVAALLIVGSIPRSFGAMCCDSNILGMFSLGGCPMERRIVLPMCSWGLTNMQPIFEDAVRLVHFQHRTSTHGIKTFISDARDAGDGVCLSGFY
jgi:hypothetical protein